jgi:predicted DNA-binding transcriptional regulator YafY
VFKISRIKSVHILKQNFIRRDALYKDYIRQDNESDSVVHLILKFSSKIRSRVEEYFEEEQIDIQKNGDIIVRVSYPENDWVYSTILSYGEFVEVVEPFHIRKIIMEKVKKIHEHYKPDIMVSQK